MPYTDRDYIMWHYEHSMNAGRIFILICLGIMSISIIVLTYMMCN